MRVLVTGASGFAGRPLVQQLLKEGYSVRAAVRNLDSVPAGSVEAVLLPDIRTPFLAQSLVADCDAVVHLAGIAHSSAAIAEDVYMAANCYATQSLAYASKAAGVKVFVYVSSVRAQTGTHALEVLTERSKPVPTDAYGRSKLAAERGLEEALKGSSTAYVILRPVLMYGPNAKGNMGTLVKMARSKYALPFGGFPARRSVLGIENFCSAVSHVLRESRCDNSVFLVADKEPMTIGEILTALRQVLGQPPRVIDVPLRGAGRALSLVGKRDLALRLFNDLVVSTDALTATGWQPSVSTAQGLANALKG